jgi:hypothetical protein
MASAAAPACENNFEVVQGHVTHVDPPFLLTDINGGTTAFQVIYVDTDQAAGAARSLDETVELSVYEPTTATMDTRLDRVDFGATVSDDMKVLVCHPDLVDAQGALGDTSCEAFADFEASKSTGWMNRYEIDAGFVNGQGGAVNPPVEVWLRGRYRANNDIPADAESARPSSPALFPAFFRPHTMWPTTAVRPMQPNCGQVLNVAERDDDATILQLPGIGWQTFDGRLGDTIQSGIAGGLPLQYGPAGNWFFTDGVLAEDQIRVEMYGSTADPTGLVPSAYNTRNFSNPRSSLRFSATDSSGMTSVPGSNPPDFESTVAYGRVDWDFLWHGTCSGSSPVVWCLPDGHRRLTIGRVSSPPLVAESDCETVVGPGSSCEMDCPTGAGSAGEVKYDFDYIEDFVSRAYSIGAGAVGATNTLHDGPRQRAAIRVAAYSPTLLSGLATTDDFVLPSFVRDECIGSEIALTTTDSRLGFSPTSTGTVPVAPYDDEDVLLQIGILSRALLGYELGGTRYKSPNVATMSGGTFVGYADDRRIASIDIGIIGQAGEWNSAGELLVSGNLGSDVLTETIGIPPTTTQVLHDAVTQWNEVPFNWASVSPPTVESSTLSPAPSPSCPSFAGATWWGRVLDDWVDNDGERPLVGKLSYGAGAIAPQMLGAPNARDCYLDASIGPASIVNTNNYGLRMDAWLNIGLECWDGEDNLPQQPPTPPPPGPPPEECPANGVNRDSYDALVAAAGTSWQESQWQLEIADDSLYGVTDPRRYANGELHLVDFDSAVRWAIRNHFSAFNFFNSTIPDPLVGESATEAPFAFPADGLYASGASFCSTAAPADTDCLESQIRRLLTLSGPRIHLHSASMPTSVVTGQSIRVKIRLTNEGNAPLYYDRQLFMRWFNPQTGTWAGPMGTNNFLTTDFRVPERCLEPLVSPGEYGSTARWTRSEYPLPSGQTLGQYCNDLGPGLTPDAAVAELGIDFGGSTPTHSGSPGGGAEEYDLYLAFLTPGGVAPIPLAISPAGPAVPGRPTPATGGWYYVGTTTVEPVP